MFGYIRPYYDDLKMREYELYRSVYCGLCKHLGKDYGIINRIALSYDCTALAMLNMAVSSDRPCVSRGRCVFDPFKKCMFCNCENDSLRFASAVTVIMTYYKLQDTIEDSGFFKKTAARIARLFFLRSHNRAKRDYPEIEKIAKELMTAQSEAEKTHADIDSASDPTAKAVSQICALMTDDESQKKVLSVFGYYLGRWIYLMDAADDLSKDIKSKSFNPFIKHHDGDINKTMDYCNSVLNMTASQLVLAYDLLTFSDFRAILDNIVYDGLSFEQKKHLFDRHKKKEKKKDMYPVLSKEHSMGKE